MALEMALREQNRRQNPNHRGEHPRAQVIPAIPSTPASPSGSDRSEDNQTLSWPIFVNYQGSSAFLLVCDGMSIASLKNAVCDRPKIPPHTQSLTTNSTTRFLIDHMTIQQCGITRDATVEVLKRGTGL